MSQLRCQLQKDPIKILCERGVEMSYILSVEGLELYSLEDRTAVVLASGGMDSSVLLSVLKEKKFKIVPIAFNYHSKHNDAEFDALCKVCEALELKTPRRFDLSFINTFFRSDLLQNGGDLPHGHYTAASMSRTVVPGRNSIMLSIAAGFAESLEYSFIAIANHMGDHSIYSDCRLDFICAMAEALYLGTDAKVSILAPFTKLSKAGICSIGQALATPLELTWSCYEGKPPVHCGSCGTCVERYEAFKLAGVKDLTQYLNDPSIYLK